MIHPYIDSHAHLFSHDYKNDLDAVLQRAQEAGVHTIVVPGTDVSSSREAIMLAEQHKDIFVCVGIHPHEASKAGDRDLAEIEMLSAHPKVVAIGEIGLDYHYNFSPRDMQRSFFARQLDIAVKRNLPVVLHMRESTDDSFSIVEQVVRDNPHWKESSEKHRRGVFHCFPGTADQADFVFKLGFYVSYPGIVTFKKSDSMNVLRQIGIENLLLETDSPYMTPVPLRGQRNEPANVVLIGRKIADELALPEADLARMTSDNAIRLFNLPQQL